jgi:hypothetical protein
MKDMFLSTQTLISARGLLVLRYRIPSRGSVRTLVEHFNNRLTIKISFQFTSTTYIDAENLAEKIKEIVWD